MRDLLLYISVNTGFEEFYIFVTWWNDNFRICQNMVGILVSENQDFESRNGKKKSRAECESWHATYQVFENNPI